MFIEQPEIFIGLSEDFIKVVMKLAVKESYEKGDFIFHESDPADNYYILLRGQVRLSIGDSGQVVFALKHPGDAFGWSSLVGRDFYSASAECVETSELLKIERDELHGVLKSDTANGLLFYQHLAASLGERLLRSYKIISAED